MLEGDGNSTAKHEVTRVLREPVRRTLRVVTKQNITPGMLRVLFHSDELQGFDSPSPDDHVKVFIPGNGDGEPIKRDFTPRAWDLAAGTLTLDFALHESGPATEWARAARSGDVLEIAGPRGSTIVPDDFDWYLLIGDATALPSFGRRLEALRPKVPVQVFVLVADATQRQSFKTDADCRVIWLDGGSNPIADASTMRVALNNSTVPSGDGFVWIAAERSVSRGTYQYLIEERHHPAKWIKASAYWTETRK
jgi:NADPH-dependent ferric siderophore reductase